MEILRDAGGKPTNMGFKEQDLFMLLRQLEALKGNILKAKRLPSAKEKQEAKVLLGRCIRLEAKALGEIRRSAARGWGARPDQGKTYTARINRLVAFFSK